MDLLDTKTPHYRYFNDPEFRALVDVMVSHIERTDFTPTEMREAAMLASIIYAQMHIKVYPIPVEAEKAMATIEANMTRVINWAESDNSNSEDSNV